MGLFKKAEIIENVEQKILWLDVESIVPNPNQPRKIFNEDELFSLGKSIEELGILQPLSVRKVEDKWELIAGERRLRASELVGLHKVPCILHDVPQETSSILALVENIQRQDLDFMEEAQAMAQLISLYGLSQDEVAKRLGKSQSTVANMIRLLKLSDVVVEKLREGSCTQRHARALLKLQNQEEQLKVIEKVIERHLNVSQTEELIETYLHPPQEKNEGKQIFIIRDVRLFLNSVNKCLDMIKTAGVDAKCVKEETEEEITLNIRIPTNKALQVKSEV